MSMFDSVHFKAPFPDSGPPTRHAQTKDLECELEYYLVTEDGWLAERDPDHIGSWSPFHFTGEIDLFFDAVGDGWGDQWFEYRIRFEAGKMVAIERLPGPVAEDGRSRTWNNETERWV